MPKSNPKHKSTHLKRKKDANPIAANKTLLAPSLWNFNQMNSYNTLPNTTSEDSHLLPSSFFPTTYFYLDRSLVELLSTDQIIALLHDGGVEITPDSYIQQYSSYTSSVKISDDWENRFKIRFMGKEELFLWIAADILWRRFLPNIPNRELLDDLIDDGNNILSANSINTIIPQTELLQVIGLFQKVWDFLQTRYDPKMKSINELDRFEMDSEIYNWSLDLIALLGEMGKFDPTYYFKSEKLADQILTQFPKSESFFLRQIHRLKAEMNFYQGKFDSGDKEFQLAIDIPFQFVSDLYIEWADMYWFFQLPIDPPLDKQKIISIYRKALTTAQADKENIMQRLEYFNKAMIEKKWDKCRIPLYKN